MVQNYGSEYFPLELQIILKTVDVYDLGEHFPKKLSNIASV